MTIACKQATGSDPVTAVRVLVQERVENRKDKAAAKFDGFWVAVDTEIARENLSEAINLANENKINMARSHPLFEYWLLLHFERSTKAHSSVKGLERDLKHAFPSCGKALSNANKVV